MLLRLRTPSPCHLACMISSRLTSALATGGDNERANLLDIQTHGERNSPQGIVERVRTVNLTKTDLEQAVKLSGLHMAAYAIAQGTNIRERE
jgi:hypothetical protein